LLADVAVRRGRGAQRTGLRELTSADLPAVAQLFERVYPQHRWVDRSALERSLHEVLFANPWRDAALPSWIAERDGRAVGFAGVLPRRMLLGARPVLAAVGCLFMVDPASRGSLLAPRLARALLDGPQDLFIADGANDEARRLLAGAGGRAPLLYGLHWTRPLRPARYSLSLLESGARLGRMALALRPVCAPLDTVAARLPPNRFHRTTPGISDEPLSAAAMTAPLREFLAGSALRPVYDASSLAWLLGQAALKRRHGALRARGVRDERGQLLGWFVYYTRPGEIAEVLQIIARLGAFDVVVQRLFADAWREGACALRGRLDPRHLQELSDRRCWLRREGTWTLVHSRHGEVLAAFERGAADLSRLDGEWWMRFLGG